MTHNPAFFPHQDRRKKKEPHELKVDLLLSENEAAQGQTHEQLRILNRKHADRVVCAFSVLCALFWAVDDLLDIMNLLNATEALGFPICRCAALLFLVPVVVYVLTRGKWVQYRYFALLFLSLVFAGIYVFIQGYMAINFCLPILLAALYFSRRFTLSIGCFSTAAALVAYSVLWQLQSNATFVEYQTTYLGIVQVVRVYDLIVGMCLPMCMILILVTFLACTIADYGKKMVKRQADVSARAARVASELETAATLQKRIMPVDFDIIANDGMDLFACVRPAKETAGDFYDFFVSNKHTLNVVVADVSDKGLRSAMFMMLARNTLRALLTPDASLADVAERANKLLARDSREGLFVTALIMRVDTLTGRVEYINAGHLPPLVLDEQGTVRVVDDVATVSDAAGAGADATTGATFAPTIAATFAPATAAPTTIAPDVFMGMFDDATYSVRSFVLRPGDTLVGFTDGILDAENSQGEFFGKQRLYDALVGAPQQSSPEEFCASVLGAVDEFAKTENRFDDATLLALRFSPHKALWLPAQKDTTDYAVDWVNEALAQTDCSEDMRRLIDVAVDEVIANIVNYAYEEHAESAEYAQSAERAIHADQAGQAGHAESAKDGAGELCAGTDAAAFRTSKECAPRERGQGVLMHCWAQDGKIVLVFCDEGVEFDPTTAVVPKREFGGLGIQFIKTIMDDVRYFRRNQFNVLWLEKRW